MPIDVRRVTTRRDLRRFVALPGRIHAAHQGWVPPFYADDRRTFDPGGILLTGTATVSSHWPATARRSWDASRESSTIGTMLRGP